MNQFSKNPPFPPEVEADLLLRYIDICSKGMVKPYDPTQIARKIHQLKKEGVDTSFLENSCPLSAEIRDCIDLKAEILLASDRFFEILNLRER